MAKRYDTNVFFKDSIKEVLGDTIGFSNREENLILESNFHTAELERFYRMALENEYQVGKSRPVYGHIVVNSTALNEPLMQIIMLSQYKCIDLALFGWYSYNRKA